MGLTQEDAPMTHDEWFEQLYGHATTGWLSIFAINKETGRKHIDWVELPAGPDAYATVATRFPTCDVWHGCATRKERLTDGYRGGASDTLEIPGLWLDIDIDGPNHKTPDPLPVTVDQALELVGDFPIPPTAIVHSGGGLQVWWLFAEMIPVTDAADTLRAWGATWAQLADARGWHLDNVFEMARVMRLPGSTNRKTTPTPVTIIEATWDRRFGLDDLEQYLVSPPEPPEHANRVTYIGPERPGEAFNARHTGHDMLTLLGFHTPKNKSNGQTDYTRPGKDNGTSATVYPDGHTTIWSDTCASRWPGIEVRRPYDPFGLYTVTQHGGDFIAAATKLGLQGYGEPRQPANLEWIIAEPEPAEWGDPQPLDKPLGHGPPFPVAVLPKWMADQVTAVAESFQVPVDLPAMLALGAISIATMGHARVKLTGSKWSEHTNLYLVCAMPPGAGKSPVFKAMTRCLVDLQAELMERQASTIREAETMKELLEQRAKAAFTKAAKVESPRADMDLAISLKAEAEEMTVPPKPRLLAEDTTPEALVSLMGDHGGRMALLSSEGGVFDMMAGQYSDKGKTANLNVYLQGWSGDAITQDRIGRAGINIERALLAICVTTQPTVITRLGENPDLAGRGLPVRFMFALPPSNVGFRDRWAVLQDIADTVQGTYDAEIKSIGANLARFTNPGDLKLTERARDQFITWDVGMEHRQRPDGDLAGMAEWVSKLRATVLRLAGLLHIADGGDLNTEVDEATVARALVVADYWEAHARIVHDTWAATADPVMAEGRFIVEWAVKDRLTEFSASDLQAKHRRHFERIKDVVEPLEFLVGAGWLRAESGLPVEVGKRGQQSPRFTVHPDAANKLRECAEPPELSPSSAPFAHLLKGEKEEDLPTSEFSAKNEDAPYRCANGAELPSPQPVVEDPDDDEDLDRVWFDDDDNPINPEETP